MSLLMKTTLLLLFILFPLWAKSTIPDSTTVRTMGRVLWLPGEGVRYDWSGTRFDFSFTGSSLSLRLDDANNHYEIYIDDEIQPRLKTIWGDSTYLIAENLSVDTHSVRIERRTEQNWGKATFKEIILHEDGTLLPAPPKPDKRFLLLGDSYTTGYGCEHPSKEGDAEDFINTTNTSIAFGSLVGKEFNADYQTLGFSGKGLIRNASADSPGKEYPLYYDHLFTTDINHDSTLLMKWDHSSWIPQIIAIHLGINDFAGDKVEPADSAQWKKEYLAFIDTLLHQFPDASIIVMSTGDWPHNLYRPSAKEVVTRAQSEGKPVHLYDYSVAASALHWHPSVSEQQSIADGLIALIKQKKLWEKTPVLHTPREPKNRMRLSLLKGGKLRISGIPVHTGIVTLYTTSGKKLLLEEIIFRKQIGRVDVQKFPQRPLIVEVKTTNGIYREKLITP